MGCERGLSQSFPLLLPSHALTTRPAGSQVNSNPRPHVFTIHTYDAIAQVPAAFQPRALTWGIIGAVAMRGAMIFLGVAAIQRFRWVVLLFAGILLGSAFKLLAGHEDDGDLKDNAMMRLAGKLCNAVDEYDGDRFFTTVGFLFCLFFWAALVDDFPLAVRRSADYLPF